MIHLLDYILYYYLIMITDVEQRYRSFLVEFEEYSKAIGRRALLVAVSKTKSLEYIQKAYNLGQRDFGENYAQELRDKAKEASAGNIEISWHYIGQIQENKIKYIVGKAILIHTIDSIKKAQMINAYCSKKNLYQDILLQINISDDSSKGGIGQEEAALLFEEVSNLERVKVCGLMTIVKYSEDPEDSRPHYRNMKNLASKIENEHGVKLELSMGMSGDYKVALDEGSTIIRVGSKIFGERA